MVTPQLKRFGPHRGWLGLALLLLTACTTPATKATKAQPDFIRQALQAPTPAKEPLKTAVPEYAPMVEDLSPIKTRMVDISARNTPLSDVHEAVERQRHATDLVAIVTLHAPGQIALASAKLVHRQFELADRRDHAAHQ